MTLNERIIKSDIEDMIDERRKSEVKKEGWMPSEDNLALAKQVLDGINSADEIIRSMDLSNLYFAVSLISARTKRLCDESEGFIDLVDYSEALDEEFEMFQNTSYDIRRIMGHLRANLESILEPY